MKKLSIEEAVRILEDMKVKFPVPRAAETQIKRNDALEMAIKALATDINVGDKDTISRKAAIDEGMSYINGDCFCDKEDFAKYIEFIEQLPPAQPEQLEQCPIYGGMCAYPSNQCYDCPRHAGAKMESEVTE
jgi:hypothetical protein